MNLRNAIVLAVGCALSVLLVGLTQQVSAQQSYGFTLVPPPATQYTDLVNDTAIAFDTNGFYQMHFPVVRSFPVFKRDFAMRENAVMHLGEGGFVRFDDDSSTVIIDGAFTYLDPIDETSRVSYVVEDGEERVLKYQYKHHRLRAGPDGNFMNMQIWLHEKFGIVEVRYGPRSENNATGYTTATGPNVGLFSSRNDFQKQYEKLWVTGNPDAPTLDSATNYIFRAMSGLPENGTVYRFTPRWIPTSVEDHTNNSNDDDALWAHASGTLEVYDLYGRLWLHDPTFTTDGNKSDHQQLLHDVPHGMYIVMLTTSSATLTKLLLH